MADGRLGNQLFQFAFLKTIQSRNEKIIVSGFEELKEVFSIGGFINLNKKNRLLRGILFRLFKPFLILLSDVKVISSIQVDAEYINNYHRESTTYTKIKGILGFITFVKLCYFQSEKFFNEKIFTNIQIKEKYLNKADQFLNNVPDLSHKVVVHIRRGDYEEYTVYGKKTLLPISYYHEQIKYFINNKPNSFFIFLSDDSEFVRKEFDSVKNKIISINNKSGTDFAIMTKCNSAILSPSSFGWWGTFFMTDRDTVFVPKYWLGFNSKEEFPKGTTPDFAEKITIIE